MKHKLSHQLVKLLVLDSFFFFGATVLDWLKMVLDSFGLVKNDLICV